MPTVTFLFTDIEGSTTLLQRVGDEAYAQVLAGHHELVRSTLAAHDGREVDTAGDGFFAVFSSARGCVAAVLAMQRSLGEYAWPAGEQIRVRMGVHCGEAAATEVGWVGLEVHRAARIAAVAHGGQVLLSEAAAVLARGGLPAGVTLRDLGVHRLKDLGTGERIFQLCGPGLQPEFPPLRSVGNSLPLTNLPAQPTSFIGRDGELAEVRALVQASRLVTLTGPGGTGKTRLGLEVAAGQLDGCRDGVWLVELAAVTSEDAVASAILEALRIPAQPGRQARDTLLGALGPQNILIVLDNCEHLIGECAKTADTVLRRCPDVRLIATSREPLGIGGETIYRVPSLSLPVVAEPDLAEVAACDAVALFFERATAQGVGVELNPDTAPLVVSVCARLDGMPLAIELAAARLRSMSLGELAGRLDQRFRLLTGGSRTALERQQTLHAAIGWSYALLTAAEQTLLQRLSVFAGSFDLPAADAVCGYGAIDSLEVAGLLGSLADKSLVVAESAGEGMRYRLLETIRMFAAELLAQDGDQAGSAGAAHCAHYLAVAEAAAAHLSGPEEGGWFDRLEIDRANLRRAMQYTTDHAGGTSRVLRFSIALYRYWLVRHRNEETELFVRVLQRPESAADPALFAEALAVAGVLTLLTDLPTSLELAHQADEIAEGLGDDRLLTMSRAVLGVAYYWAGQPDRALPSARESVEHARRLGDDFLLGFALLGYAQAVGLAASGPVYAEAIACTERTGDLSTNRNLHIQASWAAQQTGDIPAARAHLEAAVRAAEAIGDPNLYASANLGWVQRAEHDLDGARATLQDVLRIGRRIGDKLAVAFAINGLACLASDLAAWQRAAVLHAAAQAVLDTTGVAWPPQHARYRQESIDQIATALSDEQQRLAQADGMALSVDQATYLALAWPPAV